MQISMSSSTKVNSTSSSAMAETLCKHGDFKAVGQFEAKYY